MRGFTFLPSRVPMNALDSELDGSKERDHRLETWGARAVIFGIAVEFVLAVVFREHKSLLENWGPVGADALVGLGIAVEVHFAARAGEKSEELRRRSNERLSTATLEASNANERAAKAEQAAAETHERAAKLEQLTGWRKLTQTQFNSLVIKLRAIGVPFRPIIEYERGDPEAYSFVYQLAQVLTKAGGGSFQSNANSFTGAGVFGILFATGPEIEAKLIWDAFASCDLPLSPVQWDFSRYTRPDGAVPNIYFFVAPKPPPIFVFSGEAMTAEDKTDSTLA